jgi:hypothetical protein
VVECTAAPCLTEYTYTPVQKFDTDSWQSIRFDVDLTQDVYDFYWSQGGEFQLLGNDLGFRSREQVHLDRFTIALFGADAIQAEGDLYLDNVRVDIVIESPVAAGDFSQNGILDVADIDMLTSAVAGHSDLSNFNLNADAAIDADDIRFWIVDLLGSWQGDANLDGEFNSADLVQVLAAGTYEADVVSVWSTGDFDGDARTNSTDLVAALADGGYEQGPRAVAPAVPEPHAGLLLALGILLLTCIRRAVS